METSAIVLAGGFSRRFGVDKGLVMLGKKPLIRHVLEKVDGLVDEKTVVVSSNAQASNYSKAVGPQVCIEIDAGKVQTPLNGAATGLEKARGAYSLLLACDTPFISREVLSFLLELSAGKSAVIPRWPNCQVEPLQSVYFTKSAREAAKEALREAKLNMQAMMNKLRGIRFVSTLVLQQLDPELRTFFNINTPMDLKKAESMMRRHR